MHAAGITCSSGSATCSPACSPPPRPTRSGCSARPGRHDPAAGPGGDHRPLRHRTADRTAPAHWGPRPAAGRPHPAAGHADRAGRPPARPPDPRPPGTSQPARGRPAAARRDRGLETARTSSPTARPSGPSACSPAHWPRTSPTACRRRSSPRSAMTCSRHPSRISSRTPAPHWRWTGPTWKPSPGPRPRHQRLRRPRSLLGTPLRRRPRPGQRAVLRLLPLRRHHDARGARPGRPRAGPADDRLLLPRRPGPRPGPRAHRDARPRHPARRHPGRLRLRPPRRRSLGPPAPAVRRGAGPGPAPARPRPPRHPPRRHHRQRQPVLPGHPPPAAGTRARWPATPPPSRPPPTTSRPPRPPGTNSARSPPTTPTATTG